MLPPASPLSSLAHATPNHQWAHTSACWATCRRAWPRRRSTRSPGRGASTAPSSSASCSTAQARRLSHADKEFVCVHAWCRADLSTPLLPPALSKRVADDLGVEFEQQAAKERELGLPVTVSAAATPSAKAAQELTFVRFVVAPLFTTLASIVPALSHLLPLLDATLCSWEQARAQNRRSGHVCCFLHDTCEHRFWGCPPRPWAPQTIGGASCGVTHA